MTHKSADDNRPVALFPGSFNPFTLGHLSIVERCAPLFSRLVIAVGYNKDKATAEEMANIDERIIKIQKATINMPNVSVQKYSGLTVDEAKTLGATFIVRGVRDVADFEYERRMADVNRAIAGIETLLFFTLPQYSSLSSSMVRELEYFGHDVSQFLP